MLVDPHAPTSFHPGSEEKLRVMEARRALGLPLFLDGDRQGARRLNREEPSPFRRSQLERRLLALLNERECPVETLAALTGSRADQGLLKVLWLLKAAGIAVRGEVGWKLAVLEM